MNQQESFLDRNRERANRAADIIDTYRHTYDEWSTDQEILTDILADLLHCCHQQTLNFACCLEIARAHFKAEIHGDD
jgi:hypothetical protein